MAGILFEDIFDVKDIDPEGKKFDRGEWGRRPAPSLRRRRPGCSALPARGSCALPPPGVSPRPPASSLRPSRWRGPSAPSPRRRLAPTPVMRTAPPARESAHGPGAPRLPPPCPLPPHTHPGLLPGSGSRALCTPSLGPCSPQLCFS